MIVLQHPFALSYAECDFSSNPDNTEAREWYAALAACRNSQMTVFRGERWRTDIAFGFGAQTVHGDA
jgi:hypothetical protein